MIYSNKLQIFDDKKVSHKKLIKKKCKLAPVPHEIIVWSARMQESMKDQISHLMAEVTTGKYKLPTHAKYVKQ